MWGLELPAGGKQVVALTGASRGARWHERVHQRGMLCVIHVRACNVPRFIVSIVDTARGLATLWRRVRSALAIRYIACCCRSELGGTRVPRWPEANGLH